jgi:hypothetical protein
MNRIKIKLAKLEKETSRGSAQGAGVRAKDRKARMEFHIHSDVRQEYSLRDSLFSLTGNVILADMKQTRELAA